jgi:hypothetical protein
MACPARAALMVIAAGAGAVCIGPLAGCRFEERAVGGPYMTGELRARRTTALPIETGIVIEARVMLSDAASTAVAGRTVTLEVSGSATVTLQPESDTGSDGITRGVISAGESGDVVVQAYVLPPGLERVALPPLTLTFVADAGQTLVLSRMTHDAGHALAVAAGDLDGDGTADLIVLEDGPGPQLQAWRGGSTFLSGSPQAVSLSGRPAAMAVADFNHDGRTDIAVGRTDDVLPASLEIILSGSSGLAHGPTFELASLPRALVAGNLDGRGAADLVVAEPFRHETHAFYFDDADPGTVQLRADAPLAPAKDPVALAVAPVYGGDDLADLASALSTSSEVTLTLGTADGLGSAAATWAVAGWPLAVGIGDLNGDGLPDIAVACAGAGGTEHSLILLLAQGGSNPGTSTAAAFAAQPPKPLAGRPTALAIGDLSGDGRADVAVLTRTGAPASGRLEVFVQGVSDLYPAPALTVPDGPLSIAIADWNADSKPDAAVASYGQPITVFLGE